MQHLGEIMVMQRGAEVQFHKFSLEKRESGNLHIEVVLRGQHSR